MEKNMEATVWLAFRILGYDGFACHPPGCKSPYVLRQLGLLQGSPWRQFQANPRNRRVVVEGVGAGTPETCKFAHVFPFCRVYRDVM